MTRLSGNNQNRSVILIGTLIAAALVALALYAVRGKEKIEKTFTLTNTPFIGKADAPVTVVVIEDFKCPRCKDFNETVIPELKTKYADTGKAKIHSLFMNFIARMQNVEPNDSRLASQGAKCVFDQLGNEGFEQFKDFTFRAQGAENVVWASKSRLKELAAEVTGIDQAKFDSCIDTDATAARVDAEEAELQKAGINGTPTVFVNNKLVANESGGSEPSLENISKAIEAAAAGK